MLEEKLICTYGKLSIQKFTDTETQFTSFEVYDDSTAMLLNSFNTYEQAFQFAKAYLKNEYITKCLLCGFVPKVK